MTKELIKAMETHVMPNHGYMDTLVLDQGSVSTSGKFKDYAEDRKIKLNLVAQTNHKANSLAERLVGQVHEPIKRLGDGNFSH